MADEGFVLLWRKAFSHELWTKKRVFSEWEAWVDLWAHQAAFADHTKFVAGKSVAVARGQLVASQRFLAKRWKWSVDRVRRFLVYLEDQDMMMAELRLNAGRVQNDTGIGTLYTVVKYPLMQDLAEAIRSATNRQPTGNQPKIKKGKKGIEDSTEVESLKDDGGQLNGANRETWLTSFGTAWTEATGGEPTWGALAKFLRPLIKEHGDANILQAWQHYLKTTEPEFLSPKSFASKIGHWQKQAKPRFSGYS